MNSRNKILAGFALGVLAGLVLSAKKGQRLPISHRFQEPLSQKFGLAYSGVLAGKVDKKIREFSKKKPVFKNSALNKHLEEWILPGLSLYQVLLDEMVDQKAALQETERVLRTIVSQDKKMVLFKNAPSPFAILRAYVISKLKSSFPKGAWDIKIVSFEKDVVAFDISKCFYQEMLDYFGSPELTKVFCALDEELATHFPKSITFKRKGTIGRGDKICDFRYEYRQ